MVEPRKHFIVKHGLDAFEALPHFIWRTDWRKSTPPARFPQVSKGSRWISFAYTTNDDRTRSLSLVTGFYECIQEVKRRRLTEKASVSAYGEKEAWMIEGKPTGKQPRGGQPVAVPPLHELLQRSLFNNEAITPITKDEFESVRRYVVSHQFDRKKIPFLQREPYTEQEVLAVIISGYRQFGIEKIIRIQTRFPDLLVKLERRREPVHLEVETYSGSFLRHGHQDQVRNRRLKTGDKNPIAVLCWIDDDDRVKRHVHKVFALQDLLRDKQKIRW